MLSLNILCSATIIHCGALYSSFLQLVWCATIRETETRDSIADRVWKDPSLLNLNRVASESAATSP